MRSNWPEAINPWRRHVIDRIDALHPNCILRVLCGPTGSAKTRVLQALAARGAQVLDLEAYGTAPRFGAGRLARRGATVANGVRDRWRKHWSRWTCNARSLWKPKAAASKVAVPRAGEAPARQPLQIEIQATPAIRLEFLLRDYANLGDDPTALAHSWNLRELHGRQVIDRWQSLGHGGRTATPVCRTDGLALRPALHPVAKRTLVPVATAADRAGGGFVAQRHRTLAEQVLALPGKIE